MPADRCILWGGAGLGFIGIGFICAIWSIIIFAMGAKMSNNIYPPLLTVFFVIIGLLLFVFGLMSEIMMKTYYGTYIDTPYSIKTVEEYK